MFYKYFHLTNKVWCCRSLFFVPWVINKDAILADWVMTAFQPHMRSSNCLAYSFIVFLCPFLWNFTLHMCSFVSSEDSMRHPHRFLDFLFCFSSVQSLSCVRLFVTPWTVQHARLPYPSPTPISYLNSCSLSRWCHTTISSSAIPFSSHLQSFLATGSFPTSQFFASGGEVLEFQLQYQSFQ